MMNDELEKLKKDLDALKVLSRGSCQKTISTLEEIIPYLEKMEKDLDFLGV